MDTDPGILCFQHCCRKIFCFQLPNICPECGTNLQVAQFQLLPFRVPYPFVRANQHPCTVIIKPTTGDFLKYVKIINFFLFIGKFNKIVGYFVQNTFKNISTKFCSCNEGIPILSLNCEGLKGKLFFFQVF